MEQIKKPLGKGLSVLILAMVLVLVLVGYFFIILRPLLVQIDSAQSEITQTQTMLEGLRAQQQKYVQMKQTLQEMEETGVVVAKFDNEVALLQAMNSAINGVATYKISTSISAGDDQKVVRRSYSIAFECANIWQTQTLISGLSKIPYRHQISALTLANGVTAPDTESNIWNSSISGSLVITFFEAL